MEPPHGAAVVVLSRSSNQTSVLLLHRAHHGPNYEGDWAWTPPSGGRIPGETPLQCAVRELFEETGLTIVPTPVATDGVPWAVFVVEVPAGTVVFPDGVEHDQAEWVALDEALARCRPAVVAAGIAAAAAHS
jgi:8-oxo-dGTP pyrophosphatase MutT (NUDIX family)